MTLNGKTNQLKIRGEDMGGMVALYLGEDAAKQLVYSPADSANVVAPADMHITLVHFKADPTPDQMEGLKNLVSELAGEHGSITGKIEALTAFPPGDDGTPLVMLIDSPELPAFRQSVEVGVRALGIEPSMDHGFIPHVTIAYLSEPPTGVAPPSTTADLAFEALSLEVDEQPDFSAPFKSQKATKARIDVPNYHRSEGILICKTCKFNDPSGTCNRYDFTWDNGYLCDDWQPLEDAARAGAGYEAGLEDDEDNPQAKAGARHNRRDKGALQKIHDFTVSIEGASCDDFAQRQAKSVSYTKIGDAVYAEVDRQFIQPQEEELEENERITAWIENLEDDSIVIGVHDSRIPGDKPVHWSFPYEISGNDVTLGEPTQFEMVFQPATTSEADLTKSATPLHNALKAVEITDDQLIVENAIVLFGGRDLNGILNNGKKNPDGSRGEYFTKATQLESPYTESVGRLAVNWEHGLYEKQGEPGQYDILGYVDWSSLKVTDVGAFVRRILDRRNQYVKLLEPLIEQGLISTSSEAIPDQVKKSANGQLQIWPLLRDTLTVAPLEPRMTKEFGENVLAQIKALVDQGVVKFASGSESFSEGGGRPPQEQTKTRLRLKRKQLELN